MRMRGIVGVALALFVVGAAAEAGLPKAVFMLDRVSTSGSRGLTGIRLDKYSKATWGNQWKQSLSRPPAVLSPYVRTY